jgi:hypothetical protein
VTFATAKTRNNTASDFYLSEDALVIKTPQDLEDVEVITIGGKIIK